MKIVKLNNFILECEYIKFKYPLSLHTSYAELSMLWSWHKLQKVAKVFGTICEPCRFVFGTICEPAGEASLNSLTCLIFHINIGPKPNVRKSVCVNRKWSPNFFGFIINVKLNTQTHYQNLNLWCPPPICCATKPMFWVLIMKKKVAVFYTRIVFIRHNT